MDGTEVARGCAQQERASQEGCQKSCLCSGLHAQDKAPLKLWAYFYAWSSGRAKVVVVTAG